MLKTLLGADDLLLQSFHVAIHLLEDKKKQMNKSFIFIHFIWLIFSWAYVSKRGAIFATTVNGELHLGGRQIFTVF